VPWTLHSLSHRISAVVVVGNRLLVN